MEDSMIVSLYLDRNEDAIAETDSKYGKYLLAVAENILSCREDSRECVNDTYMRAWNSIPPHMPEVLRSFLAKITRRLSIDMYRSRRRAKREGSEYAVSLSELEEVVGTDGGISDSVDAEVLGGEIEKFLLTVSEDAKSIFVMRYFYFRSVKEIARELLISAAKVKTTLFRLRGGLREHLNERGYDI